MVKLHKYITLSACYAQLAKSGAYSRSGLTLRQAIAMVALLQVPFSAISATFSIDCVRPARPYMVFSPADLETYRPKLVNKFESYFNDIGSYVACPDKERTRVMA